MTKLFNQVAKLFFMFAAVAVMTSCGSDDPEPTPPSQQETQSKLLEGKWTAAETILGDDTAFDALTLEFGTNEEFTGGSLKEGGIDAEIAGAFGSDWAFEGSSTTALSVGGTVNAITINSISAEEMTINFTNSASSAKVKGVGTYTLRMTK
ncbi:hypothetical protein PEDI_21510 [Persicobacter diffluens]|uniref:Lipocalin-like domain-containing protein n=2 Tax=Persicobacter diffluens TaxID=981 RepID=A0AAN5AK27_9BACT|nr:hypothetical protein PEDI_21510 [Persicobacter diffluens]